MLLPYTTLTYYGPGVGAMLPVASAALDAVARGVARAGVVAQAAASVPLARATRLVNAPMVASASATMVPPIARGRGRMSVIMGSTALSQSDVTGAVLEAQIEPGITLREALRIVLAANAGKLSGATGGTITIRNPGDTVSRIVATVDGNGNRTAVTLDASNG